MGKRVLLVQPNYYYQRKSGVWTIHPPMGLAYIAAVLEKNNIPVKILDANALNLSIEQTVKEISDWNADMVGISILTPGHNFAIEIAKKLPPSVMSVAGGPHAAAIPEILLKNGFSIVARGEGEETCLDLALGKNLIEIPGISFKDGDKIKHNPDRAPLDINSLPIPARHLLISNGVDKPYSSETTQYFPWATITTSRGCPYSCNYCNKLTFGRQIRYRSPENVMEEIDFLVKNCQIKEISVSDDCFNFDLARAKKILDLLISRDYKISIRFSNGLRADKIDEEFLEKAKKAGCSYIAIGIESGSQEILNRIPKGETLDDMRKAVAMIKKAGIPITGFFIIGLLGDTKETMEKTINFAKELDLDIASFNMAVPYPGTRMWDMIKEDRGEIFLKDWDDFHHTSGKCLYSIPGMSDPKTVEMMYRKAISRFYFRPGYILKQIFRIRSFSQIKNMFRGLKTILRTQKK
ncbi:MAG: radical SAM protein [Patescibacteria group bacterium]